MTLRKVTVLGTGIMGAPMARNIAAGGFEVTVWNRTLAKAERLGDVARVAASPAEAVAEADVVVTMLENGAVVTDLLFGGGGAAQAAPANCLFLDMSSIQPSVARDHAALLEKSGKRHLDAPVSGGEKGAIEATLAIMAGGGAGEFAEAAALLKSMGNPTHVGGSGAGQVAKLANQAIVAVTIGAVAEALLLAQEGGCDPVAVRAAIMGGFATSRILELHGQRMLERNWVPGGPLRMQLKDLNNVLEVARETGLALPLTEKAQQAFAELNDRLAAGEQDHSAYLLWLEALNPGKRLGDGPNRFPE